MSFVLQWSFSFPTGTDGDSFYASGPAPAHLCPPPYYHGLPGKVNSHVCFNGFLIIAPKNVKKMSVFCVKICFTFKKQK